ncbi:phage portal protein [Nonomuraea mesophila]|uniref:Phage portal protein n=1 Tax=Nonomuraea mesophila TaxID=2530382 RepID=A0A4V6PGA2_9ACTN|nr:phage portal protein [Nonomuraea mesophila]TDE40506.1 phage portal protein [Nonomuraea mesophila]
MSLFRRALGRRTLPLNPGEPWSLGPNTYYGQSRPVNGKELPTPAEFQALTQQVYKRNGAIAALMFVRMHVFSEARFAFRDITDGQPGKLHGGPGLAPLERPWPGGTTSSLLKRAIQDADLAGNGFVARRDDGTLKRLRPDWVTIVTGSDDEPDLYGDAIDGELLGYIYSPRTPGSAEGTVLLPDQVAHFAPIPDPEFNFRGMSWLTPVIDEIAADTAAVHHKRQFFGSGATSKVVVSVGADLTPKQFQEFVDLMEAQNAGVLNAYKTMYLGAGADAKPMSMSMRDLDYKAVQAIGESRLAAAAGVPPVIVGFSEGLAGSSLNAGNYASARRRFADATMRPLWRDIAGALAAIIDVPDGSELWWNDRDVAFLREDLADIAEIQSKKSITVRNLTDAGYDAASVVAAVEADDFSLLRHSGLFSVQLQPPATAEQVDEQPDDDQAEEGQE